MSTENTEAVLAEIQQQIQSNPIILYMKGTPEQPQCGFSYRAAQCLDACGIEYAFVDVLARPEIRATLPKYANWPTFPQLYVHGELVGGCDIIVEMHQQGELLPLLQSTIR
jgi:monothiol glutaredoxin